MTNTYSKAYTEVLEIISHFSEDELKKIPQEEIDFYNENKDNDYQFTIDPSIDISEQNISREANAILVILYRDYFANEKQKEILEKVLKKNEQKAEEEKRKKYNPDDLFENNVRKTIQKESQLLNSEVSIVEYKESIFKKIINKIKKFFRKD